jgi:hypothetical protein
MAIRHVGRSDLLLLGRHWLKLGRGPRNSSMQANSWLVAPYFIRENDDIPVQPSNDIPVPNYPL